MKRALLLAPILALACSSTNSGTSDADAGAPPPPTTTLAQTCARGPKVTTMPATCNGDAALCAKTYDVVTVPMTHNAHSVVEDGFGPGVANQDFEPARQLADGIRGMMLDLHYYEPETNLTDNGRLDGPSAVDQVYFCHGTCAFGKKRALDDLCQLTSFLDQNPGEVLSIIFETYVTDADTAAVLKAAGLDEYAFAHPDPKAPWPTLREMIDSGKRLVVFVEKGGGDPPWIMPAYEGNVWETPYSFDHVTDFNCNTNRGLDDSPLYLINHWLGPLPAKSNAEQVNVDALLGKRVADCTAARGRKPTFVSVDFYDVGDLFSVVKRTNGL